MKLAPHIARLKGRHACVDETTYLFCRLYSTDASMAAVIAAATPQYWGAERLVHLSDDASTGQSA
ncbi:MAG: hypothetical protein M3440_09325, partial [Chloroflexota bacterium]|nr:hypothetical protein [Chloroflexota bacterium]